MRECTMSTDEWKMKWKFGKVGEIKSGRSCDIKRQHHQFHSTNNHHASTKDCETRSTSCPIPLSNVFDCNNDNLLVHRFIEASHARPLSHVSTPALASLQHTFSDMKRWVSGIDNYRVWSMKACILSSDFIDEINVLNRFRNNVQFMESKPTRTLTQGRCMSTTRAPQQLGQGSDSPSYDPARRFLHQIARSFRGATDFAPSHFD